MRPSQNSPRLAPGQVKSGNKLPLMETVTETDATTPFSLSQLAKSYFCVCPHYSPIMPFSFLFFFFFFFHVALRTSSPQFIIFTHRTSTKTRPQKYLQSKGGHASQASGYIEKYGEFKAKGINEIYIITVNDRFVSKCVLCSCLCAREQLVVPCSRNNRPFFLLHLVLPALHSLFSPSFRLD